MTKNEQKIPAQPVFYSDPGALAPILAMVYGAFLTVLPFAVLLGNLIKNGQITSEYWLILIIVPSLVATIWGFRGFMRISNQKTAALVAKANKVELENNG